MYWEQEGEKSDGLLSLLILPFAAGEACIRREAKDYPSGGEKKLVTSRGRHVSAVRRRIIPLAAKKVPNLKGFPISDPGLF